MITFAGADQKLIGAAGGASPSTAHTIQEAMMKFAWIGAAAIAATAFATPALAQAAVEEPGYCAQYYPNANCQNYGPGNPATDPGSAWRNDWQSRDALVLPRGHRHHRAHRG